MASSKRPGGIELDQDLGHERVEWRVERVGWAVMALTVVAALAGLLGPGPLSSSSVADSGARLRVEYDRFLRYQAPAKLRIELAPGAVRSGSVRISFGRAFVDAIELRHVDPPPARVDLAADRLVFTFNAQESALPAAVMLYYEPNRYGRTPVSIGLDDGPGIAFSQLFYP